MHNCIKNTKDNFKYISIQEDVFIYNYVDLEKVDKVNKKIVTVHYIILFNNL